MNTIHFLTRRPASTPASSLLDPTTRSGVVLAALFVSAAVVAQAQKQPVNGGLAPAPDEIVLDIARPGPDEWTAIYSPAPDGAVSRLERSSGLNTWTEAGVFHGPFQFFDPATDLLDRAFYRTIARPLAADDDWKNQIALIEEPFRNQPQGFSLTAPRWVKFAIVYGDPPRVYFQDSAKRPFHYEFATERLDAYRGMSRAEFDQISLFPDSNQEVALGAVLFQPEFSANPTAAAIEVGVQLVGQTPYAPEQIVKLMRLVRRALYAEAAPALYYMPTFEQSQLTEADKAYLEESGVRLASPDRWALSDQCYAPGWAVARLRFVPAAEIVEAYETGALLFSDILLTDAVPAEIPPGRGRHHFVAVHAQFTRRDSRAVVRRAFRLPH